VTTVLGLFAGGVSVASMVPQLARSLSTRSSSGLSWGWLLLLALGTLGWVSYGALVRDIAVSATNLVMLVLVGALILTKAGHRAPADR